MLRYVQTRPQTRRRGAAIVELAVVLPVLMAVILGIVEFGRAMMVSNLMTSAAREGAREACLPDRNDTEVKAVVVDRLTSVGIPATTSDVKVYVNGTEANASSAMTGDSITVTTTITVQKVTWLPTNFFMKSTDKIQGTAIMRRE